LRTVWIVICFGCLLAIMSGAEEGPVNRLLQGAKSKKKISHAPKLYDLRTEEARPIQSTDLLPHRAYLLFVETENRWVWTITTTAGKLSNPMEILAFESVVNSTFLGGLYPSDRYRLSKEGRWIRTEEEERHNLLVLSDPPRLKWITFNHPLPNAKREIGAESRSD
jgi:hypothetical protein